MNVTVAICTWNRADLLDQTLAEIRKLDIPPNVQWELLVVDNNCSDHTDQVVERYSRELPVRRLVEPHQGHSHARNCAVKAARGDLLLWTDDDVLVDRNWLAEYVRVSQEWPDAAFFGGTVDPWFAVEPPRWLKRHVHDLRTYVITQQGLEIRTLSSAECIVGANMGFRMTILRQFPFNTRLGRVGSELVGADDTELIERIRHAGYPGLWVGTARVRHFIPAERMTRDYIRRWYVGAGRTRVRQHGNPPSGKQVFGVPSWVLRQYYQEVMKSWWYSPLKNQRWLEAFRRAATLRGMAEEIRAQRACQSKGSH